LDAFAFLHFHLELFLTGLIFREQMKKNLLEIRPLLSVPHQKVTHPKPPAVFENISLEAAGSSPKTTAPPKLRWACTGVSPG